MKFSCTQENLNGGLSAVSHIASKNINLPILNNILIKAEDGLIKLLATNLEIGVTCTIRGKVEEEGSFTVPARVLADYINLAPKEKVDVELKGDQLDISCGSAQTKMRGEPATEFPLIPQIDKKNPYTLESTEFLKTLQQVVFAVAISETRPEISGVLLEFNPGEKKIIAAATDSYRLGERKLQFSADDTNSRRIIIPTPTLQELQRILSNISKNKDLEGVSTDGKLVVYLSDNQILFVYENIELISRIIEGQYPNYSSIIPDKNKTQVIVNTADMIKAVKSASLFVKSGINDISLEFRPEKEIIVSAINSQVGESTSVVEANITGEQNEVVLNFRYLLDGLQAVGTSEVLLEVVDNNTPVVLKPVLASASEGVDRNYLYLIMPIKQ